ncbi:MAG: HPr family phosphocarrier protein [Eubacteriaceae bacterium]|nr:HPr family phosphocarrier protein [Eubacteriaceae bacterium]
MTSKEVIVLNATGLHARPASMFVQEAGKYKSEINVIKDGKKINAKSIMGIMAGGISKGTALVVEADGEDEAAAVDALVALIESKFGEE